MELVRLVNWCIESSGGRLLEKWLVRVEADGSYREIVSGIHRRLLDSCMSIDEAVNVISSSHNRPIPYHRIHIVIGNGYGCIHNYIPKKQ